MKIEEIHDTELSKVCFEELKFKIDMKQMQMNAITQAIANSSDFNKVAIV
jgi:hypothetical protein